MPQVNELSWFNSISFLMFSLISLFMVSSTFWLVSSHVSNKTFKIYYYSILV